MFYKPNLFQDKCYSSLHHSFKCGCAVCPLVLFVFLIFLFFCTKIKIFYYDLNSYLCFASAIYYNRKVCLFWINVIHPCVVLQMSLCPLSTCPLCLSNIFFLLRKIKIFYYDLNSYLCFASPIYYNRKVHLFWINVILPCVVLQMSLYTLSTCPLCLSNILFFCAKIKIFDYDLNG
jgi:hypothetical protein